MPKRLVIATLVLSSVAAAGCGNSKASDKPEADPAVAQPEPKPRALPGVEVFVNDQSITRLAPDQVRQWVQLSTVLPQEDRKQGMWAKIDLKAHGDTLQTLAKPSDAYPDQIPALYPGDNGSLAFGMFNAVDFAKHNPPSMSVSDVREVRITVDTKSGRGQNEDGNNTVGDPRNTELTIKTNTASTTLKGDSLLNVPQDKSPNGSKDQGWKLTTLLAAAKVTTFDKLLLTDATGTNLSLDKTDVTDTSVPFVKLNKQAKLKLRVFKKNGDGWTEAGNLRELKTIEVVK